MKLLEGYNKISIILHWLIAIMIISLFCVGLYMHDLPREDSLRPFLYMMHKASGMMVIALLVLRVLWRLTHKPPSLDRYGVTIKRIASFAHIALYALMLAVPLAGFLMSSYHGYPVNFFGLFKLPLLVAKDKVLAGYFGEAHYYLALAMMGIVVFHAAGALKHRFFDKK